MAREAGQIIAHGASNGLVRVYLRGDEPTGTRKYLNQTIQGMLREAKRFLNLMLEERDNFHVPRAAVGSLNRLVGISYGDCSS